MVKICFFLVLLGQLSAKAVVDFKADAMWFWTQEDYLERPGCIYVNRMKHHGRTSNTLLLSQQHVIEADQERGKGYKKIIACLMEPRILDSAPQYVAEHIEKFDLVVTFDHDLLMKFPEKCRYIPPFVPTYIQHHKIHEKKRLLSMVVGNTGGTWGRVFRQTVFDEVKPYLNAWKTDATPRTEWKDEWMDDVCFSIALENCQTPGYFTEKILDCFNSGTIPIYWGCPNLGDYFDLDGVFVFHTLDELRQILKKLSYAEYQRRMPAIIRNFHLAKNYPSINFISKREEKCITDLVWEQINAFGLARFCVQEGEQ